MSLYLSTGRQNTSPPPYDFHFCFLFRRVAGPYGHNGSVDSWD